MLVPGDIGLCVFACLRVCVFAWRGVAWRGVAWRGVNVVVETTK